MMDIRPIRSEADYDWALGQVEQYFLSPPPAGSEAADRFDVLSNLIEAYEQRHWPIEPTDPVEAIAYSMDMKGFSQSDLAHVIGSASRASEILNRKRPLTLQMIQKLNREWHIPAEALIAPYHLELAD